MTEPVDLEAARALADAATEGSWGQWMYNARELIPTLCDALQAARSEVEERDQHIATFRDLLAASEARNYDYTRDITALRLVNTTLQARIAAVLAACDDFDIARDPSQWMAADMIRRVLSDPDPQKEG
jgi:hypothetical protein